MSPKSGFDPKVVHVIWGWIQKVKLTKGWIEAKEDVGCGQYVKQLENHCKLEKS